MSIVGFERHVRCNIAVFVQSFVYSMASVDVSIYFFACVEFAGTGGDSERPSFPTTLNSGVRNQYITYSPLPCLSTFRLSQLLQ